MFIASGTSSRHLQALSEILVTQLKKLEIEIVVLKEKKVVIGKSRCTWLIVHIFHPEKREFYDLEKMWSEEIPKEKAMIWED